MTDPWTQDPLVREDADLRALLDRLASTASEPVDPATRAATLERVLAAASERAATPVVPTWRRRAKQVLAMTGAKVALAAGVAAATTGGLAATGTLPQPAQEFVHDVGRHLGIGFPDAPGQLTDPGDPASTHAPGHQARTTGGDTGASTHAPGRIGRDDEDPAPVVPLGPGPAQADRDRADKDKADHDRAADAGGPDDPGAPVRPDAPARAPAEPGPAPAEPRQAPQPPPDADGDAPGSQPEHVEPPAPRSDASDQQDAPASSSDASGESGGAPGRTGGAPPQDSGAPADGRP